MQRFDRNKSITVHIDDYVAQTGASRFLQLYDAWKYNKTENMEPAQLSRFDFLLIGSSTERHIMKTVSQNFSSTHRILYSVKAFQKLQLSRLSKFPYYWPVIKLKERVVVLKKLD